MGCPVYLGGLNGPHGEVDNRCRIVARMSRSGELVAENSDASLVADVDRAAEHIERAVRREIGRPRRRKAHAENGIEKMLGEFRKKGELCSSCEQAIFGECVRDHARGLRPSRFAWRFRCLDIASCREGVAG